MKRFIFIIVKKLTCEFYASNLRANGPNYVNIVNGHNRVRTVGRGLRIIGTNCGLDVWMFGYDRKKAWEILGCMKFRPLIDLPGDVLTYFRVFDACSR